MNNVVLIGRLASEPELRFLPGNGMAVCKFSLAVDKGLSRDKKAEFQAQGKPTADFIRIIVWGKQGEMAANYLAKGRLVGVQGSIVTGSYVNQQGQKVYTTEVNANKLEFLEWGDSNKNAQNGNSSQSQQEDNFGGIEGFQPVDDDDIPF